MSRINLGRDQKTGRRFYFDTRHLPRHLHVVGSTGSGKSVFLQRIIFFLMMQLLPRQPLFILDPLGGLCKDVLNFVSHSEFCTDEVRDRIVYIAPGERDHVMPINSLRHDNIDQLYFRASRTSEAMLFSGASQDVSVQLRLKRWLYNTFMAVASLGLPPAAAQFLIETGTDQHNFLLSHLPRHIALNWAEVLNAGPRERIALLDSTRNRLHPFFSCPILNRMLSTTDSFFDVDRFIRERKIVLINLAPMGVLNGAESDTIGRLIVNEIIQCIRNRATDKVQQTTLIMDEFQGFITEELLRALPQTRGLGLQLILAHQSFSQLKQGEIDFSKIVWQAQSRAMFANSAEDAETVALELAAQTFDPYILKDQIVVSKQRKIGQEIVRLRNHSDTQTSSNAFDRSSGSGTSRGRSYRRSAPSNEDTFTDTDNSSSGWSEKNATSQGGSDGWSETLVDMLEDFKETASRTYFSFEEQMLGYGRDLRNKGTGKAFITLPGDPIVHDVAIQQYPVFETPMLLDAKAALLENNFSNRSLFLPQPEVDQRWNQFVDDLGVGKVVMASDIASTLVIDEKRISEQDNDFR
jgi:hypothetical protein